MIQDFVISYVCNGVKTTLTIEDEHYDNMPYKLADMFEKVIRHIVIMVILDCQGSFYAVADITNC